MLITDDNSRTLILESVHVPTTSTHFWVLDLQMLDFTLHPLEMFEEHWDASLAVQIEGFQFSLPKSWNILIVDQETSVLDVVGVNELAKQPYEAVVYDNERNFAHGSSIKVVDYSPEEHNVNPSLNRHQMLCHPISEQRWVCVAPNDPYNKYLKELVLGDIM